MTTINDIEFIIPCAGLSTRNYPQSKGLPHKSLLPFGSYRLIDHILKDIFKIGGRNITIIVSNEEVIHAFKNAFKDDSDIQKKLEAKGRFDILDVVREVEIPEDADIKYVIQEKALGTGQCLALAYDQSEGRHGVMIFPDDIYISKDESNTNLNKFINNFLNDDKRILVQGIKREDVSNNAILVEGRLVEKPKNPTTNIGGFSPVAIPKECMKNTHEIISKYIAEVEEHNQEWFHVDAINDFLDKYENEGFSIDMPVKDDEDLYMDTGSRPLYEKAFLRSLILLSKDKEQHMEEIKEFLN
ncbi:MAG: sugar phosphate nucleotidyltransferase [Alphaproteobacteria bacterium]|jgi:UTP-glucose-1-phosphate uridylyltransferase|nr:sugar phosphate nucleotidyltransferase [Alphaproteobacteria bacterium]MCV6599132.1 sugar phosphate nucleotidyltransferase [Alphaproteobacteria bacterium]